MGVRQKKVISVKMGSKCRGREVRTVWSFAEGTEKEESD